MRSVFTDIAGNNALRQLLGQDIEQDRLSHAYILEGACGSGKHMLAIRIAAALACENRHRSDLPLPCMECPACKKILAGNSPDVITVSRGDKATFGVEAIRELHADVHIAPNELDTKLYLLEDAHLMTPQAQNAFLLTLEEPPPYVLFLLLTENALALLETVRSRAPVRRMELLSQEQLTQALTAGFSEAATLQKTAPDEFFELIATAGGSMGQAIRLLDAQKRKPVLADRELIKRFVSLVADRRANSASIALLNSLGQKREELTARLSLCLLCLRDLLLLKRSEQAPLCFFADREAALALSCRFSAPVLFSLCEAVNTAVDSLRANGNVRLVLTQLGTQTGLLSG